MLLPPKMPVTIPLVPIVATAVFVLLHTPPPTASDSATDTPAQTAAGPVMLPADGNGLMVMIFVADEMPHEYGVLCGAEAAKLVDPRWGPTVADAVEGLVFPEILYAFNGLDI